MKTKEISSKDFVRLTVSHQYRIHAFTRPLVANRAHCEDVVQNTFMTAWQKIDTFRFENAEPDEEFVRWVCTIARFEAMAWRRKSKGLHFSDELIAMLADTQMEQQGEIHTRLGLLTECIQNLSSKDKTLVHKKYLEGVKMAKLAQEYAVCRQTVSKWFKGILVQLRRCIQSKVEREGVHFGEQ